jgi:hypothetical protein
VPRGAQEERVEALESIRRLAEDKDWLPNSVRLRILGVLDSVASRLPGADAAAIDLVQWDLRHELSAYREFSRFRDRLLRRPPRWSDEPLEVHLHAKRKQLRARIQARRARDADRAKSGPRFRFW